MDWSAATALCGVSCLYPTDCPTGQLCYAGVDNTPCANRALTLAPNAPPTTPAPIIDAPNNCPPVSWTCPWPPADATPCCSQWGWAGDSAAHCGTDGGGGVDSRLATGTGAIGDCYCRTINGVRSCPPFVVDAGTPANCTGDPELDAVLSRANFAVITQLTGSSIYTWNGFCVAMRKVTAIGVGGYSGKSLAFFLGAGAGEQVGSTNGNLARNQALVGIASFMSQCMWESGGDAPWTACDENNFQGWATSACTQRPDGQLYHTLTSNISCGVDNSMTMTAETYASWTPGPLTCAPGTATAGCCWWGRGAIQTTGPHNYAALQRDVISNMAGFRAGDAAATDLCTNPEAMCQHDELKWVGALYYWVSIVQADTCFTSTLRAYGETLGAAAPAAVTGCYEFPKGTGGAINNGIWNSHAHGETGRIRYFNQIMVFWHLGVILTMCPPTKMYRFCAPSTHHDVCHVLQWCMVHVLSHAEWCSQSDGVPDSRFQGAVRTAAAAIDSAATSTQHTGISTAPAATSATAIPQAGDSTPCDNGAGSCKMQCQTLCVGRSGGVSTNQCWGNPRYIECRCSDGSTHAFEGCACENAACAAPMATTASPAVTPAETVPHLVGIWCPTCGSTAPISQVIAGMPDAYRTVIVRGITLGPPSDASNMAGLTRANVATLKSASSRKVLLAVEIPLLNCSSTDNEVDRLTTATTTAVADKNFDGVLFNVSALRCVGASAGGHCTVGQLAACGAIIQHVANALPGQTISVAADMASLDPASSIGGTTVNVAAVILSQLDLNAITQVVVDIGTDGNSVSPDATSYLLSVELGFSITSAASTNLQRVRRGGLTLPAGHVSTSTASAIDAVDTSLRRSRRDAACFTDVSLFHCVVNPAHDPSQSSWCMTNCLHHGVWNYNTCVRSGVSVGQAGGAYCTCFCNSDVPTRPPTLAPITPAPTVVGATTQAPTATVTAAPRATVNPSDKKLIGYYTNWAQHRTAEYKYEPYFVDATLLTHICYAFAIPSANYDIIPFEVNDITGRNGGQGMYARFHTHVRAQNPAIRTLISLGGWSFNNNTETQSRFTNMCETQANRAHFIASCIAFARLHTFDGVDIDWEYPGHAGQGGRPQDKANFVLLLAEFRAAIATEAAASPGVEPLLLTIAVGAGASTVENAYDIAAIHPHLDWIGVMAYDFHGSWESTTGMHTSMDAADPMSVPAGMARFRDGGCPDDKLIMGFGTYGRGYTLTGGDAGVGSACSGGSAAGPGTAVVGFLSYIEITAVIDAGGIVTRDSATQCPYVVSGTDWVGYDDVASLQFKANYAMQNSFGGGMVWALDLDDFNNGYPLVTAIKNVFDNSQETAPSIAPSTPAPTVAGATPQPSAVQPTRAPVTLRPSTAAPVTAAPATRAPTMAAGEVRTGARKMIGYYSNWAQYRNGNHGRYFPEDIDATLLTHICYAFAMIDSAYGVVPFEWNDVTDWNPSQGMYARFHTHVRAQNSAIRTLISLGGWTFNERTATKSLFTNMAEAQASRATFIASCIAFARLHTFDGVDIDWEYPGHAGQGGRPQDKANFVLLLAEFRAAIATEAAASPGVEPLLLTIAVGAGASTVENAYDIAAIHPHLDWIGVMAYDFHGSWESTTGMHTSMDAADPMSVPAGMARFRDGGCPDDKLIMGFGTYGRGYTLTGGDAGVGSACSGGSAAGPGTAVVGFLSYIEITAVIDAGGIVTRDSATQCPYVVSGTDWVGYDDVASLQFKANYAMQNSFGGGMFWALDLDDWSNGYPLVTAVKNIFDGARSSAPSAVNATAEPTAAPAVLTTQAVANTITAGPGTPFAWVPVSKLVPAFPANFPGRTAAAYHASLVATSVAVGGIGAVSIELDYRRDWAFASAFRPSAATDPPRVNSVALGVSGGLITASVPANVGACTGCRAGGSGYCKKLSDASCWDIANGQCPVDAVECANDENTLVVGLPLSLVALDVEWQNSFKRELKAALCSLASYSSLYDCNDTLSVVIVSMIDVTSGSRRRSTATVQVGFYATNGATVIPAPNVVTAVPSTVGGVERASLATAAATGGPTTEFGCAGLRSSSCSDMQSACGIWCRGDHNRSNCNLETQHTESFPVGTVVHRCACITTTAQATCTFQAVVQTVDWAPGRV